MPGVSLIDSGLQSDHDLKLLNLGKVIINKVLHTCSSVTYSVYKC